MVYPEDERRIIKIRKNHRDYRKEGRRKAKAARFLVVGILLAAGLAVGYYVNLPKLVMQAVTERTAVQQVTEAVETTETVGEAAATSGAETADEPIVPEGTEPEAAVPEETAEPVKIIFTGDVWLDPAVQKNYEAQGISGVVDDGLHAALNDADICVINNEFAFSTQGQQADKQYTYRVDPKYVTILGELGTDIAGLANNHALDFGPVALSDTFATLDGAGIRRIGAGDSYEEAAAPAVVEKNGQTFAFLAATHVIPEVSWNVQNRQPGMFSFYDETGLLDAIAEAKAQYDHVFVLAHWGQMRTTELANYQINDGRKFIDAGADAVIGAHPHVLQGIEAYNGGFVFYSLGDFISTNRIDQTAAVEVSFDADGMAVKLLPASCVNYRTALADQAKAEEIYGLLRSISSTADIAADGSVTAKE